MNDEISKLTTKGVKEILNEKLRWKYDLSSEDEIVIPKFYFNIQTNFKMLENSEFMKDKKVFSILNFSQQTAFILDEKGAEIESETDAHLLVTEELPEEEIVKPKKCILTNLFYFY